MSGDDLQLGRQPQVWHRTGRVSQTTVRHAPKGFFAIQREMSTREERIRTQQQYIFQDFCFGVCHGQVGGTIFQVGVNGADQRRYLRPDE